MNNNLLCYENSVNWHDINPHVTPSVEFKFNSTDYRRPCGKKGTVFFFELWCKMLCITHIYMYIFYNLVFL